MMCQCVFYTTHYKQELLMKFEKLQEDGEMVDLFELTQHGNVYKLGYVLKDAEPNSIETCAHVVSDIIQKVGIIKIAKEYLSQRKDLLLADKKELEKRFIANNYLSSQEGFSAVTYYLVYIPLLEALKEHHAINIEGWLRFRLSKYKIILEDILEQFIQDYFIKQDIVKWIGMIREMSSSNDALEEILHLVYTDDGKMCLLNEQMKDVTFVYRQQYCKELLEDPSLNEEDIIMNILISVSPRRIVIHQRQKSKQPQFIKTLEGVFGINMRYCKGCRHCVDNTNSIQT